MRALFATALAAMCSACTGEIFTTAPRTPAETTEPRTAGSYRWQRLSNAQFDNTIEDLLVDDRRLAADGFSAEGLGSSGFASPGLVSPLDAERFESVATALAAKLPIACTTDACAKAFLDALAERAFRRPLTPDERAEFDGLYATARDLQVSVPEASRWVVEALLQSPAFLYLGEPSPTALPLDEKREPLDGHAVAARVSYFLWGTLPDAELSAAARAGELETAAQLQAQARRMLGLPAARASWHRFFDQWLRVGNVAQLTRADAAFAPARADLLPQFHAFVDGVLANGDGRLETLLTSNAVYVTAATAPLLGTTAPTMALERESLPHRYGLLTQLAVLASGATASEEDPIRRGKLVREAVLCQSMPAPPPNIPELPAVSAQASVRERHEQHFSVQPCRSCHVLMDPIGYGFGHYDAVGRYREKDGQGRTIDVTGQVHALGSASPTFDGPQALAQLLARSAEVRACMATQWLRFALGRGLEPGDGAGETQARTAFAGADYDVRELLVAIATSDAMRFRAPAQEATP